MGEDIWREVYGNDYAETEEEIFQIGDFDDIMTVYPDYFEISHVWYDSDNNKIYC